MLVNNGYFNPVDEELENELEAEENTDELEGEDATEDSEIEDGIETEDEGEASEGEEEDDDPIGNIVDNWMTNQTQESPAPRGEEYELLNTINESRFMKELIRLKKSGYTDEQIQRGLGTTYAKMYGVESGIQEREEEQQGIDLTDPRMLAQFIQEQIQQGLNPIKQRDEQSAAQQRARSIQDANDRIMTGSIARIAKTDKLKDEEVVKIRSVFNKLYPGFDATQHQLTQEQSDAIIAMAFRKNMKNKAISNNMKAPNIPSGKATSTQREAPKQTAKINGLSKSERAAKFSGFFNNTGV
jgi:hypothetical protein